MSAPAEEMTKSARKRANQKARAAEEAPAPAPEPAPAPKAKGKAKAAPAPEPKAEAKAKGKAKAKPEAKAAAPEPVAKAEPKAKGKAKAEPKAAAAAPAPAAETAAKAKSKSKAKKEKVAEEAPKPVKPDSLIPYEMDDGQGGEWEVSAGVSKKLQKQQEKAAEKKKDEEDAQKALKAAGLSGKAGNQSIPGMASAGQVLANGKKGNELTHVAKAAAAIAAVTAASAAAKAAAKNAPATGAAAGAPAAEAADPNSVTATVKIDPAKIGRIIGPKGATIALIKEKTGVRTIDTAGDLCVIVGLADQVVLAEQAIQQLNEKGYMSLSFDAFKEDGVSVPPFSIASIVGERGSIIQLIKKECKVEIDIPPTAKGSLVKKVKISVAGDAAGVEKAKEIIESIALYSHHEVTHPGFSHAELEVEEWRYRFLIGKGGCEMRHIQNNYKVKVNIPRENPGVDKVLVVGEERDVERAVKYIEKILFEADQAPKGREEPKAEDTWGDEGPEEAWMSAYMYKR